MTAETTEHVPCAGCTLCLSPTPKTSQQVSFTVSPGKWPLWLPTLPLLLPCHFAITLPAIYNKLDDVFPKPCRCQQQQMSTE